MGTEQAIQEIGDDGLNPFLVYIEDQLTENGRNGTPLFQPHSRDRHGVDAERAALFRLGIAIPVGEPKWRRLWGAFDETGTIIGHVDLRAHQDPSTAHRALLGMGVHREHRRRGVGRSLLEFVIAWAVQNSALEWIDLDFLAGNAPAEQLYRRTGFKEVARIADMFRVDGQSVDSVRMTRRIRR